MKKVFLVLVVMIGLVRADSDVKKVVYALTTSDLVKIEKRMIKGAIHTKEHYKSNFKVLDAKVIIHGGAYKFFVKDISKTKCKKDKELEAKTAEIHKKLESLKKTYGIKFSMCSVGMNARNITKDNILEFVDVIPSAVIGLIDAQNDGYAVVPIN